MGGSGGGSAPAQPSTTTQIQDIPEWEQGYVTDLLGRAQTISNQPYQQFPGPEIAGFTPDQMQAFTNVENAPGTYQPTMNSALDSATSGANTAGGIYNAGAGQINAASSYNPLAAVAPYLGAASQYNAAAASQPWLNSAAGYTNAAANAATPQGISNYMSPYTNSVVNGIQNEANLNWNQNIMPGVNDKFIGSGQYASGRNAQVLGQAAGNFQTGLSSNVANALENGYNVAGQQAAQQANILGQAANTSLTGANDAGNAQSAQIGNLINQANVAGTGAQNQASNLLQQGTALGSLASTQANAQTSAGTVLGNLSNTQQQEGQTQNNALQAVGQQQQQLEQSNLTQAQTDWQNQVNWPAQQTEYLNQIIRGLPAPTAVTTGTQGTPAYTTSPLTGLSGSLAGLLGSATSKAEGGLIKGYARGSLVEDPLDDIDQATDSDAEDLVPLDAAKTDLPQNDNTVPVANDNATPLDVLNSPEADEEDQSVQMPQKATPLDSLQTQTQTNAKQNPLAPTTAVSANGMPSSSQQQSQRLLAMSRAMLAPQPGGDPWAALGAGWGAEADTAAAQNTMAYSRQQDAAKMGLEREKIEMGKFMPIKDAMGNVTGVLNSKTGEIVNSGGGSGGGAGAPDASVTGDDYAKYLKTIDPTRLAKAQSVIDGKTILNAYSLKSPAGNQMYTDAMRLDPSFDMTTGPARQATRKDFTSGASSKNITSLNTALGHAASWMDSANALKNNEDVGHPYNYLKNQIKGATSYPELTAFNDNADALADELTRTFRGSGGSVSEVENWRKNLSPNMSPSEMKASAQKLGDLIDSRLDALGTTYSKGMNKDIDPTSLLSPKAQAAYSKIRGSSSANTNATVANPTAHDAPGKMIQPGIQEGATATNKATGQKMVYKAGRWMMVQ